MWRHRFPHYKSMEGGFLFPWKPEFWSNLPQNNMQPFPHPSDAIHKIWSRLAYWLQRYSSLKVGRRTDGRWPLVYYKLTLWAFGSGELKIYRCLSFKCQRPFSSKSRMQFTIWYPPFCQQFTNHRQKMLPNTHKTRFRNKSLFSDIT